MTEAPAPAEIIVLEDDASFIETLGAVLETSVGTLGVVPVADSCSIEYQLPA